MVWMADIASCTFWASLDMYCMRHRNQMHQPQRSSVEAIPCFNACQQTGGQAGTG
jgi:hypothetical protein